MIKKIKKWFKKQDKNDVVNYSDETWKKTNKLIENLRSGISDEFFLNINFIDNEDWLCASVSHLKYL